MKQVMIWCIAVACLMGCKKDDPDPGSGGNTDKEEAFLERLFGLWEVTKVTVDGTDVTAQFTGMLFSVTEHKTYLVGSGPEPMWPPTGVFELKPIANSDNFNILRDDDVEMEVTELTTTKLVLEFEWTPDNARTTQVEGSYRFEFKKSM